MDDSVSSEDEDQQSLFFVHNAAEAGDVETVRSLLATDEGQGTIRVRDLNSCAPIHIAILHGQLEILHLLLEHSQSQAWLRCEGSTPLHMAACLCGIPPKRRMGLEAAKLLLMSKASVFDRDDQGRLPLHWAAASGHIELVALLLGAAAAQRAAVETAPDEAEPALLAMVGKPVHEIQDKQGNTALHMAAQRIDTEVLKMLLDGASEESLGTVNNLRETALHWAARGNYIDAARLLFHAAPRMRTAQDIRELAPWQWAQRCGHDVLAAVLRSENFHKYEEPEGRCQTIVLAPPECHEHKTSPEPIVRGGREPPPENVHRLHVLTDSDLGILHSSEFQDLKWESSSQRAAMSDVLRVHEWAYVSLLQKASSSCMGSRFAALDSDTIISRGSFTAALAAAGAVTAAVDRLMDEQARNAFCAVRPPGHHAGPTGIAEFERQPHGSHGFCLLNNLAIGAAYAMSQYRKKGIKKVALLDFDVHHGNGTQACIRNTAPGLATHTFETPYSKGLQEFPTWKPWLDSSDAENIFFASVQGVGKSASGALYPGSGETADNKAVQAPKAEDGPWPSANGASSGAPGATEPGSNGRAVKHTQEDPESEFTGVAQYEPGMPRIINVGIDGPGSKVSLWRRAWRNKILPALARFEPDLIFISAGFDAHRKDVLNHRYIGLHERDYEWITREIMKVANRCCEGRIVSALEGGYRIQGKIVSAFARSVAAHVRALSEPNFQEWDAEDVKIERELELHQRMQMEAAKQAALKAQAEAREQRLAELAAEDAAAAEAVAAAAAAAAAAQQDASGAVPSTDAGHDVEMAQAVTDNAGAGGRATAEDHPARSKRRRPQVDYKALDEKLKAQEAEAMKQ